MNLKQIEAFVSVAQTKSFSYTASKLFLTQPTVSAHISGLEKELNTKLFSRTTKDVRLTEDGEKLYEYATKMLKIQNEIEELFSNKEKGDAGVITISASTIPAQYILPKVISEYRRQFPNVSFDIKETDSMGVVRAIEEKDADVGFCGTQIESKSCKYINLCSDELVVITPNSDYYKALLDDKSLSWIKKEPIIVREEGSGTRREAEKLINKLGIDSFKLNIVATIQNPETIKSSVMGGMGISFISKSAVENEIEQKKLLYLPLGDKGQNRYLSFVYNKNNPMSKNINRFIEVVKGIYS